MPGSTPATSQLDWLSSTTAMIVLSWSKATRDLLKACPGAGRGRSAGASGHSVSYLPATMVPSPSPPAPYHLSAGGNRIRTIGSAGKGPTVPASVPFRSDFSVAGNRPESTINGVHLLENLKLDELVGQERRREFAFIVEPLKIQGATGSTVTPMAAW